MLKFSTMKETMPLTRSVLALKQAKNCTVLNFKSFYYSNESSKRKQCFS